MSIQDEYRAKHPKSATLAERARQAIPGGITHDIRHLAPYPVYVERAAGSRKWDVDGHEYVDYWMGHGALFLGHCHPAVVRAVQEQMARGTHLGACHELEVRWAELVNQLIPCGELTRFTMSGTEATHLAMRVARAYTGRPEDLEVGRPLPRLARRRRRRREPALRRAAVGRRAARHDGPGGDLPAQRHQGGRDRARARRHRRRHPGAGRRQLGHDADHPRLPARAARAHHAPRASC